MPISTEVHRLGAGWKPLCRRIEAYAAALPPDGVPLGDFERDCLGAVFLTDRPGIIQALKRKGLIVPVRDGLAWRVFRKRPASRRFEPAGDLGLDRFLRVIAPHMRRLAVTARDYPDALDPEGRRRMAEASRQIAEIIRRHVAKGLDLDALRTALAETFSASAVNSLVGRERVLERGSDRTVAPPPRRSGRIPNGLPPHERLAALIEKAGRTGAIRKDLARSFPLPRPKAAEIGAWLDDLEEVGRVYSLTAKLGKAGKPGLRYWHASVEPPTIINGIAVFD